MAKNILSNFVGEMKHLGFKKSEIIEMISKEYEWEE